MSCLSYLISDLEIRSWSIILLSLWHHFLDRSLVNYVSPIKKVLHCFHKTSCFYRSQCSTSGVMGLGESPSCFPFFLGGLLFLGLCTIHLLHSSSVDRSLPYDVTEHFRLLCNINTVHGIGLSPQLSPLICCPSPCCFAPQALALLQPIPCIERSSLGWDVSGSAIPILFPFLSCPG